MNWDALGAIAELLGAIGVICSLIYLAVQIRGNTRSTKAETFQRLTDYVTNFNSTLVLEPKVVDFLMQIADPNHELTPQEQIRMNAFAMTVFRHWDNVIYQSESGTIEGPRVDGYLSPMSTFLSFPRLRACWDEQRGTFSEELSRRVEEWIEHNVGNS